LDSKRHWLAEVVESTDSFTTDDIAQAIAESQELRDAVLRGIENSTILPVDSKHEASCTQCVVDAVRAVFSAD
jgi:hypothetical protein